MSAADLYTENSLDDASGPSQPATARGARTVSRSGKRHADAYSRGVPAPHNRRSAVDRAPVVRLHVAGHMLALPGDRDETCGRYADCLHAVRHMQHAAGPVLCRWRTPNGERATDYAYTGRSHSAREVS